MEVPFQYGRLADAKSFIDRVEDRQIGMSTHSLTHCLSCG